MEQIQSTLDLPSWFDLSKYEQFTLEAENHLDLFLQTSARVGLLSRLTLSPPFDERVEILNAVWEDIKISGRSSREELGMTNIKFTNSFVKQLTVKEATKISSTIEHFSNPPNIDHIPNTEETRELLDKARAVLEETKRFSHQPFDVAAYSEHEEGIYHTGHVLHAHINTTAPDRVIFAELKQTLNQHRKMFGIEINADTFRESDPKRIIDYQVLPLLDLNIWEKLENKKITNTVLAAALFPHGTKGEYEIRATIKPFIDRIISDSFLFEWKTYVNQ